MAKARTERLDARLTAQQKEVLERAAAAVGNTVSGFVVQAALASAQEVLLHQELLVLSARDSRTLAEALASPPEPTEALLRAARAYQAATTGSTDG